MSVAFADRAGVIRFGRRRPRRELPISWYRRFDSPHVARVRGRAARPRQRETFLVPGAPKAKSDAAALAAVVTFVKAVETRIEERAS
jgi:hypothetical protein